jgi:hypothetical protein
VDDVDDVDDVDEEEDDDDARQRERRIGFWMDVTITHICHPIPLHTLAYNI